MSQKNFAIYLNDHFAGAVGAIQHVDRLEKLARDPEVIHVLRAVREEIQRDRETLHELIERLDVPRSPLHHVLGRIAQKLSVLKLRLPRTRRGDVQMLHALDLLTLGIQGKKALWTGLSAGAEVNPRLRILDYDELNRRADEQLELVRELRRKIAQRAFAPDRPERSEATR